MVNVSLRLYRQGACKWLVSQDAASLSLPQMHPLRFDGLFLRVETHLTVVLVNGLALAVLLWCKQKKRERPSKALPGKGSENVWNSAGGVICYEKAEPALVGTSLN